MAPVSEDTGGVFIAYSTQANAVAQDGEGAYSPFAESFARNVGVNASIDDMFAIVTRDVLQATKGFQRPFKYASMDAVFCLTGVCTAADSKIASPAIETRTLLTTDSQHSQQLIASLRQITTATPESQRIAIERTLSDQLRAVLPKTVPYGFFTSDDGKNLAYGFDSASVRFQGPDVAVTIRTFSVSDKGELTETGEITHGTLNCKSHQLVQKDWQMNGTVKLFTQVEQKSNAMTLNAGSVGEGLEGALCTPLSFVPLWAIEGFDWLPIGAQIEVAQGVSFQEPADSDIHFIFGRLYRSPPDSYGGDTNYGWLGINCSTRAYNAATGYSLKKDGSIRGVYGNAGQWLPFEETSPAHNAYVLLCDKPQ